MVYKLVVTMDEQSVELMDYVMVDMMVVMKAH